MQKYWKHLLKKIESGEFGPTTILSRRFDITEFKELYAAFNKNEHGIMRTFVQNKFSSKPSPGAPQLSSLKSGDILPSTAY